MGIEFNLEDQQRLDQMRYKYALKQEENKIKAQYSQAPGFLPYQLAGNTNAYQSNPMAGMMGMMAPMMQMMQMMIPLMMLDKDGSLGIKDIFGKMLKDMFKGTSNASSDDSATATDKTTTTATDKSKKDGWTIDSETKTRTKIIKNNDKTDTIVTDLDGNKKSRIIEGAGCYAVGDNHYGKVKITYGGKVEVFKTGGTAPALTYTYIPAQKAYKNGSNYYTLDNSGNLVPKKVAEED
jgi:hypothetical protein